MNTRLFKYQRRSIRLKNYDYTQVGSYFITICTHHLKILFREIKGGEMVLNKLGQIAKEELTKTKELRKNMVIDQYVIMPNHFHLLIGLIDDCRSTARRAPTKERFQKPVENSIPTIIRSFKSAVTRRIHFIDTSPVIFIWQRNYYEHVVRNEQELNKIRRNGNMIEKTETGYL